MNVVTLSDGVIGYELVRAFLKAQYTGEERHQRRLNKVIALDTKFSPEA